MHFNISQHLRDFLPENDNTGLPVYRSRASTSSLAPDDSFVVVGSQALYNALHRKETSVRHGIFDSAVYIQVYAASRALHIISTADNL